MSRPQPPARVPTLTEVIALDEADATPPADRARAIGTPNSDAKDIDVLWAELKPWLDGEWEQRVQAALDPAWQALHDALLSRLRAEFELLLKEALRRALSQAGTTSG